MGTLKPSNGFLITVGVMVLLAVIAYLTFYGATYCPRELPVLQEMKQISIAMRMYQLDLRNFPTISEAEIGKALLGSNQNQKAYLSVRSSGQAPDGRLPDPWGTPYRIYVSQNGFLIRSAGPNKTFDFNKGKVTDDYFYEHP